MASKNLGYLAELVQSEPSRRDYDSAFLELLEIDSDMHNIDSKVHEMTKRYGMSAEQIYEAIDVDPSELFKEGLYDADAWNFHYSDVMRDLKVLEEQLVPAENKTYGGSKKVSKLAPIAAAMAIFMAPQPGDKNPLYIKEKAVPDAGLPKNKNVVLEEKKGLVDDVILWVGNHPVPVIVGALAIYFGGGAVMDYAQKTNEKSNDAPVKIVPAIVSADIAANQFSPDSEENIFGNATVTATPTPAPVPEKYVLNYDGIQIIGTQQFIKDIVMVNEFAKKYCIEDYEFVVKSGDTLAIEESTSLDGHFEVPSGGGGNNITNFGQNYLDNRLRGKDVPFRDNPNLKGVINDLPYILGDETHETVHNVALNNNEKYFELQKSVNLDPGSYDEEDFALEIASRSAKNASKVPQSEIDDFMKKFDFREFEKQIQVYK